MNPRVIWCAPGYEHGVSSHTRGIETPNCVIAVFIITLRARIDILGLRTSCVLNVFLASLHRYPVLVLELLATYHENNVTAKASSVQLKHGECCGLGIN